MQNYPEILIQFIASTLIAFVLVIFVVMLFQVARKKKLLQEAEMRHMRNHYEMQLLQTRVEIQETVLKEVSMEIHDNLGQIMLLSSINLSVLQTMTVPDDGKKLLADTKTLILKAGEDISRLSRSLNSDRITDLGAFYAIREELGQLGSRGLFSVSFSCDETIELKKKRGETDLLVFRMFQEISNNIIKHAAASQVRVSIEKGNGMIILRIADNGKGFELSKDENTISAYNGVGLRSLQSRAALFNGRIEMESAPGQGSTFTIFIPSSE